MESTEEETFDELWRQYYLLLKRYAHALLHDEALEKEALDELFCLVAQNLVSIMERPDPTGWLVDNAKHIIIRLMEDSAYHSTLFRRISQHPQLFEAVLPNDLSPWEEWLLTARYKDSRSIAEISSAVGISVDKCKVELFVARQHLEKSYSLRESSTGEVLISE